MLGAIPLAAAESWPWAVVAALAGLVGGRLLTACVGRLIESDSFCPPVSIAAAERRRVELMAVVVTVALWWWEVRCRGLAPVEGAGSPDGVLLGRWALHMGLAWLLAAAAWIDLRHRVIPDCVTVPGVLAGLACTWLLPDMLLPVTSEQVRSFAPPLAVQDVLAWWGGLRGEEPPAGLTGWPESGGLLLVAAVFSAWWLLLTVPFREPGSPGPWWSRVEPRGLILPVGLAAIGAAWARGGDRFGGLQSALVGVAVAAGLVWAVREAASRALGREAMGMGDVTLMAMVGAWIGWQPSVLAFFLAAFIGLAHGLLQVVRHRESELPYGPSLCLATATVIVGWRPLWGWSGEAFAQPLELAAVIVAVVLLTAITLLAWSWLRR